MKRWKVTPMADGPQGPSTHHAEEIHEGDEDSLSERLSHLQSMTGTPYAAEPYDGPAEPSLEDREAAVHEQERVKGAQDAAEEKGRPIPA